MKVAVIGAGGVGSACVMALIMKGCAREIIVVDRNPLRSKGVVTDMQYGATASRMTTITAGDYKDLAGADLVMITAGINEKAGGATDRGESSGRLKLLGANGAIYHEIVPKVVAAAPNAVILVVTDPPDPLAQLARDLAGHERVLSAGTFLDSMRFRWHLANYFHVNPTSVHADVLGEHGTSQVFMWSTVTIGGIPLNKLGFDANLCEKIEHEVRYANISIIEGIGASQYGIGMLCARIAEIVLRDELALIPIGSYQKSYGTTLSLPSIVGKKGVVKVFEPAMNDKERDALKKSGDAIKSAYTQMEKP